MKKFRTILLSIGLLPLAMWAQSAGDDVTYLLSNPDFEQSYQGEQLTEGWNVEPLGNGNLNQGNVRTGGTNGNTCYEAWNSNGFDVYQVVEGAPVGVYEIEVQGFYRYLRDNNAWNAYQAQESQYVKKNGSPVYVYMNNNATPFGNIFAEPVSVGDIYTSGTYRDPYDEYWYPDQMWSSAEAFLAGMYKQSAYGIVVKEGDVLRLGVKGVSNQGNDSWVIWDNFRLIYHGYDAEFIAPLLQTTIEECQSFMADSTNVFARKVIQDAIDNATAALGTEDGEAMFNALNMLYDAKEEIYDSRIYYAMLSDAINKLNEALYNAPQDTTGVVTQARRLLDEAALVYTQGNLDTDGVNEMLIQINETISRLEELIWQADQPLGDDYFSVDGIWYRVDSWSRRTVWAYSHEREDGVLDFPETVEQYGATFSVTGIDLNAFHYGDRITSVTIPATMTELYDDNPFSGCVNLKTLRVAEGNPRFDSRNDCNAMIETASNCLYFGCNTTVIPESVTAIGRDAFYGMDFNTIRIPSSVQSIDYIAFGNCNNLRNFIVESEEPYTINYGIFDESNHNLFETAILFVPEGCVDSYRSADVWYQFNRIVAIGDEIPEEREFVGPNNVIYTYWTDETTAKVKAGSEANWTAGSPEAYGDIVIPEILVVDGKEYTVTEIGDYAFLNAVDITSVSLPATINAINSYAFLNCYQIEGITLPESLSKIGRYAFAYCYGIQKIHIPANVTEIEERPFTGCNLKYISVDNNNERYDSRNSCNAVIETESNRLIIGSANANIPADIKGIGAYAFAANGYLTSINIPEGVEYFEDYAFYDCWNLTSVSLPQSLREIGNYAFNYCSNLQSINIPENVTWIGSICFGHSALTSFTFPQNTESVSWASLAYCDNLEKVEIPASVQWIDGYAFYDCKNLKEVVCYAEEPPYLSYEALLNSDGSYNNPIVYVPAGSVDNYKQAYAWYYLSDIRAIDESNMLYIADDVTITQGETGVLPISLKNDTGIKALQFDIALPDVLSAVVNSNNLPKVTLNKSRARTHSINTDFIDDGSIRVVITSLSNDIIRNTDGIIANLSIEAPEWLEEGQFAVNIKNVVLTNTENKSIRTSNRSYTVNVVPAGIMGDVNGDKCVDVTDVVMTIDYILERYNPDFRERFADMNRDGNIDITDVVSEIDVILGKVAYARSSEPVNTADYTAFQMDFTIPAGYTLEGVTLKEIAKESHSLAYSMLDNNRRCRVVVCSMNNEALPGTWDEVISLNLRGKGNSQVCIDHAVFVTIDGQRHELMLNPTSIAEISNIKSETSNLYDLQGRKVNAQTKKGLYIIEGKKAIVK
jgi:hypothetical protein